MRMQIHVGCQMISTWQQEAEPAAVCRRPSCWRPGSHASTSAARATAPGWTGRRDPRCHSCRIILALLMRCLRFPCVNIAALGKAPRLDRQVRSQTPRLQDPPCSCATCGLPSIDTSCAGQPPPGRAGALPICHGCKIVLAHVFLGFPCMDISRAGNHWTRRCSPRCHGCRAVLA